MIAGESAHRAAERNGLHALVIAVRAGFDFDDKVLLPQFVAQLYEFLPHRRRGGPPHHALRRKERCAAELTWRK